MPAPRRRGRAARGGRRRRALDASAAAATRELAASLAARATRSSGGSGPSSPSGVGGSRAPGSLKCLHAHAAFALARPGYELGERILAEVEPLWPASAAAAASVRAIDVRPDSARAEWEEGTAGSRRRPRRAPRRAARRRRGRDGRAPRRVGQTFTLEELADAYGGAERWAREALAERAPTPGWPRDLTLVADAAFHLYARGAVDYGP